MIFVKLRNVNLPATVTNKLSNVSNRMVCFNLKKDERGEISRFEFVSKF